MDVTIKKLFYFSVAVLVAIILFWFGSRLLFLASDNFSGTLYFIVGILVLLGGMSLLSAMDIKYHWQLAGVLLLLGIYFLARASGVAEEPWLARILGAASWVAALMMLYITWPGRRTDKPKPNHKVAEQN